MEAGIWYCFHFLKKSYSSGSENQTQFQSSVPTHYTSRHQFQVTRTRTHGQLPVNLQLALGSQFPFSQKSWFQFHPNIGQEQLFGFS